jgi:hypothetical protein
MLSVANKTFTQSVIMLSAVVLSVTGTKKVAEETKVIIDDETTSFQF